jgi:hypothetical protein
MFCSFSSCMLRIFGIAGILLVAGVFPDNVVATEVIPAPVLDLQIEVSGAAQTIFDWQRDRCEPTETPDAPPRAFKDADGLVHFYAAQDTLREFVGSDLDKVAHRCTVIMQSSLDDRPEAYADHQWLAAPFTSDGLHVFALIHDEYDGYLRPLLCPSRIYSRCWMNAITYGYSDNEGRSFTRPKAPSNVVAVLPYKYEGEIGFPVGYFQPSNIVELEGFYYVLFKATQYQRQADGICLMRTKTLNDSASWRTWDGQGFNVQFIDPYTNNVTDPERHLCKPLATTLGVMGGLAYDPKSSAFVLVTKGGAISRSTGQNLLGIVAAASLDLIHWTQPALVWADPSGAVSDGDPRATDHDPSLLDPSSTSRTFDTLGGNPYIYFVRDNPAARPYDRRLLRVPVSITVMRRP